MKNILVTGAAGFIGSALARRLINEGNKVVTIDNLSTGQKDNIPDGVIFIEGDVSDPNIINMLYEYNFDLIFHIAGQSGGMTCWEDPVYDLNSNVTSTLLLLNYCIKKDCKNFIYASSMSVYGDENRCPVKEGDNLKPKSFYAVGKMASENYMRIFSDEYGVKCTALRFNNVYGPGQNLENIKQGMVSIFLAMAIKNHHITVMGDKNRFRDFVYIDDIVEACIMASTGNEKSLFNVYTVSTNRKTTCEELVNIIRSNLKYDISVDYRGNTQGDQFGIYCSYDRIKNNLGWKPTVKLEDGIKIMTEWAESYIRK